MCACRCVWEDGCVCPCVSLCLSVGLSDTCFVFLPLSFYPSCVAVHIILSLVSYLSSPPPSPSLSPSLPPSVTHSLLSSLTPSLPPSLSPFFPHSLTHSIPPSLPPSVPPRLEIFASADAAYVLAYSIIMLTTDLHSSQV